MTDTTTVDIASGRLRGRRHVSGAWAFLGVPYGADTGGANRFRPARPPAPWAGTRDAFDYGPDCPQEVNDSMSALSRPLPDKGQDEDCLKLNVWTQAVADGGRRPVMVWLHGGGFSMGTATTAVSDGGNLAAFGDVVVVSLNHRLSALGFLMLDDATDGALTQTANLGLMDIVLALQWVRENAAAFGGDAGNVTLFGFSGGGRKVCTLMAMPAAQGLFHRAIVQSGAHPRCIPRARASGFAAGFLKHLGLGPRDVAALQAIPAPRLIDEVGRFCSAIRDPAVATTPGVAMWMISPVVDGEVLPDDPFGATGPAPSRDVPLLIGTNLHEAALHLARSPDAGDLSEAELEQRCRAVLGARAPEVLAAHRRERPDETPWELLTGIASEDRRLMSLDIALAKARQAETEGGAPAYVYLFAWQTDFGRYRAAHGLEIPFVFRTLDDAPLAGTRPDRFALADAVSAAWVAFARTGRPAVPGGTDWPAYDAARRATMVLDTPPRVEDDPWAGPRRAFGPTDRCMPWEPASFAAILASPMAVRAPG